MLEIGKLYKVPWQYVGYNGPPGSESCYEHRILINDGEYVVLLEINDRETYHSTHPRPTSEYCWVKVLTSNGETAWTQPTLAGLDWWKIVTNKSFRKQPLE